MKKRSDGPGIGQCAREGKGFEGQTYKDCKLSANDVADDNSGFEEHHLINQGTDGQHALRTYMNNTNWEG